MPTFEKGNMWDAFDHTDWFLITTNRSVTKDGLAVMGRGMALEAALRFPTIRQDFGKKLLERGSNIHVTTIGHYGNPNKPVYVGCFMVKDHWKEPAKLELIRDSAFYLADTLITLNNVWNYGVDRVDLNFPGIGNGKLKREDVLPLLECLPDYVHIWEKE